MIKFQELRNDQNMGFGLAMPPTKELMFMQALITDMNENTVTIALYAATLSFIAYLRIFMSFAVTETFGPLISAMVKMVSDILTFLALFIV